LSALKKSIITGDSRVPSSQDMTAAHATLMSGFTPSCVAQMIPITVRDNGELEAPDCTCSGIAVSGDLQTPPVRSAPSAVRIAVRAKESYHEILKATALIGGSQVANIVIGVVRTKAMAMLLGPAGLGLFGLYGSIQNLTQTMAGMGINSSGVRQIAEAAGSNDQERVARTTAVLRRTSIFLGLLGAAALVLFSKQVSTVTFGTAQRGGAVCLISLAVFFQLVSAGQGALIQGMRRIADLAKMNVIGALSGAVISIPVIYFMRDNGIALSLVLVSATTIITSWWFSRRIQVEPSILTTAQVGHETAGLLKLGIAFMVSGLMVPAVAYFVRVILLQKIGMAGTGMYQSAWTLGGLYVGFILQAMGADFYPRLSAVANDNAECNRLVNEQALIGLLLAGPGIIASLTLAPLVLSLFYSAKFGSAAEVLRWICLGATLQVVTWPMGFIIVAKAQQTLLLLAEVLWAISAIGMAWVCIVWRGLNGAGMAFFLAYVAHWFIIYPIVRRLSGFQWSADNRKIGLLVLGLIGIVFCGFYMMPFLWAMVIGVLAVVMSGAYSLRVMLHLLPFERIPAPIRRSLVLFRLAPSAS
jgi:antigen flippase